MRRKMKTSPVFSACLIYIVVVSLWTTGVDGGWLFQNEFDVDEDTAAPTPPPPPPTVASTTRARDTPDSLQNGASDGSGPTSLVGNNVKVKAYDSQMYQGIAGGPVNTADYLECKGGQICCWVNGDASSSTTLKWQTAKGPADLSKFNSNFGAQKPPDQYYLIAYTDRKRGPTERAVFESCSIGCAEGNINVEFRYWTTSGVSLQVCTRDAFFGDPQSFMNCHSAKTNNKQSGLAKVTVPGGNLVALDLVASSFTADGGSGAIIDHINVAFKPCQNIGGKGGGGGGNSSRSHATPPQVTPGPNANDDLNVNCPKLRCSFDKNNLCEYKTDLAVPSHSQQTKGFAVRYGRFENPLTGAPAPEDNSPYAAAYLYPKDRAVLSSGPVKLAQPRVLRFRGFLGAQGLRLKVCVDSNTNCPFSTSNVLEISDRKKWRSMSAILPTGTKQVFIIAENTGNNQGAVGIENIQLLLPSSGGPMEASLTEGSACNTRRKT